MLSLKSIILKSYSYKIDFCNFYLHCSWHFPDVFIEISRAPYSLGLLGSLFQGYTIIGSSSKGSCLISSYL